MWQDTALLIVYLGFVYSLIPQIIMNYKIKIVNLAWGFLIIAISGMFTSGIVLFTLNLILTPILNIITGILWAVVLIQKIVYRKKE